MQAFPTFFLAVGLAFSVACSGLGRPSVTPQTPHVTGINRSGLELDMLLSVDNPNPFRLVANQVTGELSLGSKDKKVGTASSLLSEPIAAKSTAEVTSQLEIAWSSTSALAEFLTRPEVPFTFRGQMQFAGGPVNVSVPFTLRGQLTRAQLAKAASVGLAGILSR